MNLLSSPLPWKNGAFLLQKEVAERIVAPAGGEDYGTLSIASTLAATAKIERVVPPGAFWPRPKVDSAVLSMEFKPVGERLALPWKNMRAVTNAVFGSRRKILKNALKGLFPEGNAAEKLVGLGIDPEGRGENLHPCEFLAIARLTGENAGDEPE